jgi:hypothetical protein
MTCPSSFQGLPLSGGTITGALTVDGLLTTEAGFQNNGGNIQTFNSIDIAGSSTGLAVKEGTNCYQGVATLVSGTIAVANTLAAANWRILVTNVGASGTVGALSVAINAGTGFTINSTSSTDDSTIAYEVFRPG